MTPQTTKHAQNAVAIRKTCGRYAAIKYAEKHGVRSLYRLAMQLDAANNHIEKELSK